MGQVGWPPAPLYVLYLGLVVELQSKLDVSCRLRSLNHSSSRSSHCCIGYREVDAVKRIQEIRAELQPESFCYREVFLEAEIPIVISRTAQTAELRCTGPKGRGIRIIIGVKPQESPTGPCRCWTSAKYPVGSVAVRAQAARAGARLVGAVVVERQGEARVESDDRADGPTADDSLGSLVHVTAELFALAKRQFIDGVGGEIVGFIVITGRPF